MGKNKKPLNHTIQRLLKRIDSLYVGVARFELATSWSQTRRDDRTTLRPELFFALKNFTKADANVLLFFIQQIKFTVFLFLFFAGIKFWFFLLKQSVLIINDQRS